MPQISQQPLSQQTLAAIVARIDEFTSVYFAAGQLAEGFALKNQLLHELACHTDFAITSSIYIPDIDRLWETQDSDTNSIFFKKCVLLSKIAEIFVDDSTPNHSAALSYFHAALDILEKHPFDENADSCKLTARILYGIAHSTEVLYATPDISKLIQIQHQDSRDRYQMAEEKLEKYEDSLIRYQQSHTLYSDLKNDKTAQTASLACLLALASCHSKLSEKYLSIGEDKITLGRAQYNQPLILSGINHITHAVTLISKAHANYQELAEDKKIPSDTLHRTLYEMAKTKYQTGRQLMLLASDEYNEKFAQKACYYISNAIENYRQIIEVKSNPDVIDSVLTCIEKCELDLNALNSKIAREQQLAEKTHLAQPLTSSYQTTIASFQYDAANTDNTEAVDLKCLEVQCHEAQHSTNIDVFSKLIMKFEQCWIKHHADKPLSQEYFTKMLPLFSKIFELNIASCASPSVKFSTYKEYRGFLQAYHSGTDEIEMVQIYQDKHFDEINHHISKLLKANLLFEAATFYYNLINVLQPDEDFHPSLVDSWMAIIRKIEINNQLMNNTYSSTEIEQCQTTLREIFNYMKAHKWLTEVEPHTLFQLEGTIESIIESKAAINDMVTNADNEENIDDEALETPSSNCNTLFLSANDTSKESKDLPVLNFQIIQHYVNTFDSLEGTLTPELNESTSTGTETSKQTPPIQTEVFKELYEQMLSDDKSYEEYAFVWIGNRQAQFSLMSRILTKAATDQMYKFNAIAISDFIYAAFKPESWRIATPSTDEIELAEQLAEEYFYSLKYLALIAAGDHYKGRGDVNQAIKYYTTARNIEPSGIEKCERADQKRTRCLEVMKHRSIEQDFNTPPPSSEQINPSVEKLVSYVKNAIEQHSIESFEEDALIQNLSDEMRLTLANHFRKYGNTHEQPIEACTNSLLTMGQKNASVKCIKRLFEIAIEKAEYHKNQIIVVLGEPQLTEQERQQAVNREIAMCQQSLDKAALHLGELGMIASRITDEDLPIWLNQHRATLGNLQSLIGNYSDPWNPKISAHHEVEAMS